MVSTHIEYNTLKRSDRWLLYRLGTSSVPSVDKVPFLILRKGCLFVSFWAVIRYCFVLHLAGIRFWLFCYSLPHHYLWPIDLGFLNLFDWFSTRILVQKARTFVGLIRMPSFRCLFGIIYWRQCTIFSKISAVSFLGRTRSFLGHSL